MNDPSAEGPDYSGTLFLPKTEFPMRAGLPQKEPEIIARWASEDLYAAAARRARGRPKFVLHDGPPYANGNIHIGHALNKILKDMVVRSQQMPGKDSNYVPGWDCHGLPIEWKVEEEIYRRKGKAKPDFSDPAGDDRVPPRMPRLRRALGLGAARGVQAARRRRRLGPSLFDDELSRRSADRARDPQVRRQRPALPRLQAGDVERGREDRARRSRGRVRGAHQRHGLRGVPVRWLPGGRLRQPQGRVERFAKPGPTAIRLGADLDDDAVDVAGQPRDRVLAAIEYGVYQVDEAPEGNWAQASARANCCRQARRGDASPAPKSSSSNAWATSTAKRWAVGKCAPSARRLAAATISPCRCSTATTSPTTRARASSTPRRATAAKTSTSGWRRRDSCRARHRHAHSLHGRRERRLHRGSAGLHGKARAHRQGREWRRQRRRDQGADRGAGADCARQA